MYVYYVILYMSNEIAYTTVTFQKAQSHISMVFGLVSRFIARKNYKQKYIGITNIRTYACIWLHGLANMQLEIKEIIIILKNH